MTHPLTLLPLVIAACFVGHAARAQSQTPPKGTPAQAPTVAGCLNAITKFEQSIALVRQVSGDKAATDLKEKLLPASQASEILLENGPCGLARHLRNRKLV